MCRFFVIPAKVLEAHAVATGGLTSSGGHGRSSSLEAETSDVTEAVRLEIESLEDASSTSDRIASGARAGSSSRDREDPDILCQRCYSLKHTG